VSDPDRFSRSLFSRDLYSGRVNDLLSTFLRLFDGAPKELYGELSDLLSGLIQLLPSLEDTLKSIVSNVFGDIFDKRLPEVGGSVQVV